MKFCASFSNQLFFIASLCASAYARNKASLYQDIADHLQEQTWTGDQKQCLETTVQMLRNVQNFTFWATWAWDALQIKPVGLLYDSKNHLGNFDQCLKPPWSLEIYPELKMQYCLADIQIGGSTQKRRKESASINPYDTATEYLHTPTKLRRKITTVTWGLCVPASCNTESVEVILRTLLSQSQLAAMMSDIRIHVDQTCQVAGEKHQYSLGFYVFLTLVFCLIVVALVSSCIYSYNLSEGSAAPTSEAITVTDLTRCFAIQENLKKLVKEEASEICVLNGIRVVTSLIVVLIHNPLLSSSAHVFFNGNDSEKMLLGPLRWINHLDLTVDIFFLIAGMLLAKSFVPKIGTKMENPLKQLFKRYVRLAPSFALVLLYLCTVFWHFGSGPLWPRLASTEVSSCRKNWWLNLLMASNYVNNNEQCYVISWSIPADYHFTILGIFLFHLYNLHRGIGISLYCALLALSLVLPGVYTYIYSYPHVILSNFKGLRNLRDYEAFNTLYIASHMRMSSYLIGIIFGYFIAVYKPTHYMKTIPYYWSIAFTCLGVGLSVLILDFGTQERSALVAAIYSSINRPLWATGVGIIVMCSLYGTVPIVNSLLCWDGFRPLSRLTYGIYLVHAVIYLRNIFISRTPYFTDPSKVTIEGIGTFCLSILISLALWMLVEAPANNLYNLCVDQKGSKKSKETEASALETSSQYHKDDDVKKYR